MTIQHGRGQGGQWTDYEGTETQGYFPVGSGRVAFGLQLNENGQWKKEGGQELWGKPRGLTEWGRPPE